MRGRHHNEFPQQRRRRADIAGVYDDRARSASIRTGVNEMMTRVVAGLFLALHILFLQHTPALAPLVVSASIQNCSSGQQTRSLATSHGARRRTPACPW